MRRLLSILLLVAFALPLVAPLLALAQDPYAGLPACCRRHGQHHCTMLDAGRDSSAHRVVAVCPEWPQRAVPSPTGLNHFIGRASSSPVALRTSLSPPRSREVPSLTALERLHPKRGPPNRLLA
jgi:hypothetical protein